MSTETTVTNKNRCQYRLTRQCVSDGDGFGHRELVLQVRYLIETCGFGIVPDSTCWGEWENTETVTL